MKGLKLGLDNKADNRVGYTEHEEIIYARQHSDYE